MKTEKEYCKDKSLEMLAFYKDMEERKNLAKKMISERGEEIRTEITNKTDHAIEENLKKNKERMKITEQIEKASMSGDYELVNRLLREINKMD